MHISENRLEGSLLDTDLKEVLDECHNHLVTGTLLINAAGDKAVLELRAGAVDSIDYKGLKKAEALTKLHELKNGEFELAQKLPDLSGELGTAASLEATTDDITIVKVMQLCEDNALSCSVTVSTDDITAVIRYKVGEIESVEWNGESDEDRIVDILKLEKAKLRVEAPPLKFGILSWPTVRDDPTPAFIPLAEMAKGRLDEKATAEPKKKAKKKKATAKKAKAKDEPKKAESKKADEKKADEKKADEKKADEKKADEKKADEKKADEKKAATKKPVEKRAAAIRERPSDPESSGAMVLLGLLIGLIVVAGGIVLAIRVLVGGG